MKQIMSSIWFALVGLLLSLACVGGALHLGRTELWAHGVAKAETASSSPNGSDSQQTEAGGRLSANATGLSQFLPHGVCFLWDESLLLLHVVSDSVIALAYYSIPIALIFFVRQRRDLAGDLDDLASRLLARWDGQSADRRGLDSYGDFTLAAYSESARPSQSRPVVLCLPETGRTKPPGRARQPDEERVSRQHVARAAHAAQRHHRLHGAYA